ncbi:MAG: polymer-forming cytoskeletal protein [Thermoanaerobaculia bacterium]|nr:polymer-forming cytoskeletal protein [Thermoanaerobaculia bacterium]
MSVWKKNEPEIDPPINTASSGPAPASARSEPRSRAGLATIGPSIALRGDVTGEEDLIIEGRVEGKVLLKKNSVTVGRNGRVKADVFAKTITVEGELEGDLSGHEEVIIRQSGKVRGNIHAPRVTLDSGCRFQGSIDMEQALAQQAKDAKAAEAGPQAKPAPAPAKPPVEDKQTTLKSAMGASPQA